MMSNVVWLIAVSICYFLFPAAFIITALPVLFLAISDIRKKSSKENRSSLNLITVSTGLLCFIVAVMTVRMMIVLLFSDNPELVFLFFITVIHVGVFKLVAFYQWCRARRNSDGKSRTREK